jgi:hypothetical protein
MNLGFSQNLQNISNSCGTIIFSRSILLDGVRLSVNISSCGFGRIAESHTGLYINPLSPELNSHLLFAGIISSRFSPR